jgi:L,D-transpeptidase ErfK/SrfK
MRLPKSTAAAALLWLAAALAPATRAATFALPTDGSNMVGEIRVVTLADPRNTLLDIGRHFDLGYNEITAANPGVSVWMPAAGTRIVVPTEFILPPKPWVGIVVDVPQRRLYYFPTPRPGEPARVITFPVGIARPGWPTPLGSTRIIAKYKDPSWIVPKDILQEHHQEGDARFPSYFPPGPGNPMGMLAMQTGFPAIFIHGTNRPWGVGMEVSHGCVHLYPEDAADLFPRLPVGTPVRVINQPVLVGSRGGELYVSAAPPVTDYPSQESYLTQAVAALTRFRKDHPGAVPDPVPWKALLAAANAHRIIPVPIGPGATGVEQRIADLAPTAYAVPPYGIDANDAAAPKPRSVTSAD